MLIILNDVFVDGFVLQTCELSNANSYKNCLSIVVAFKEMSFYDRCNQSPTFLRLEVVRGSVLPSRRQGLEK